MIRGIRGATTVREDQETLVLDATEQLLKQMIEENDARAEDVASVFISVTPDLTSVFPAKAMRRFEEWTYVPVICMQEVPIENSLQRCIRVMLHMNTQKSQKEIHHVYQEEAVILRPDLSNLKSSI